jgi:hypothetical protein
MAQRKKTLRRKTSTARGKARKAAKPPRGKAGKRAAAKPTPRKRRTKAPRKTTTVKKVARKTAKPRRTPRTPAAQGVPAPAAQSRTPLDLDRALSKPIEAGLIPGIVALAADDRGIFYKAAFGMRAVDKPEPMTADSVFRIASMTKAVTGAAAMQLVEQGRIGLDQPMGDVLPVVRDVKVLDGFDADGARNCAMPRRRLRSATCSRIRLATVTTSSIRTWAATSRLPDCPASSPARMTRCGYRCCSIRARTGSTASASILPARSSRR